jgi:DNA polymerase-3 subunit gamma/tau
MGQALYRKYRSKSLDELKGQEHVTATLRNALKQGRVSHAYLLSGPRGVGKTSIARILAHEINGLPYDDAAHLDIIEIDAASNRRIDEIRDLRDRVNTAPASAKYKVYIIDEVHMLTKEAFNALLKTLEEPPAHVVFILATTEAHKLPETIVSRTQRYSLRPVPQEQVIAHLKTIAKGEKLTIDDDALELIAQHGEGSFRDSISLLDQASSIDKHVTRQHVETMLGLAPAEHIATLVSNVQAGNKTEIITTLSDLYAQGYEPAMISSQLAAVLRGSVLNDTSTDAHSTLELLRKLLDVPASRSPRQLLELTLLQASLPPQAAPSKPAAAAAAPSPAAAVVAKPEKAPEPVKKQQSVEPEQKKPQEPAPAEAPLEAAVQTEPAAQLLDASELWQGTLDEIKKQYNTLYGIARMAQTEFDGHTLTLSFKFAFHQKRINEAKNRKIFADVVERLHGKPVDIICIVAEPSETPAGKPDVSTISNIFGGAELLQ